MIKALHQKAMNIAGMAVLARLRGEHQRAREFFQEAMRSEAQAARYAISDPSRSHLYRNAVFFAVDSGELGEARRLIAEGLGRDMVPRIAQELRRIRADIRGEGGWNHDKGLGIQRGIIRATR